MRRNFDIKERVETDTEGDMLGPGEGAPRLTVATAATWGTRESDGRPTDNAAAHGVVPSPESMTVSKEGGVCVLKLRCKTRQ